MIRIDRKLSKTILKISDSYDSEVFYDIDESKILFNDKRYSVPIDKSEIVKTSFPDSTSGTSFNFIEFL